MSTVEVSTAAALQQALLHVTSGEVIKLDAGVYTGVAILNHNVSGGFTIESADPTHRAVFENMTVANCSNLTMNDLDFTVTGAPGATGVNQFTFRQDNNLVLENLNVHGSSSATVANSGSGVMIRQSDNVSLTNSNFSYVVNGMEELSNTNVTISGNNFNHVFDDGIDNGGTSNIKISNNSFSSFHMDATDTDHPDLIQFWTSNTTVAAHDITITGNTYARGAGNPVQGIFIQDEVGLPFTNVTVANNTLQGTLWNGITFQGVASGVIEGNKVVGYADQPSWIRTQGSGDVLVTNNTLSTAIMNLGATELASVNNQSTALAAVTVDNMKADVTGLYDSFLGRDPSAAELSTAEAALGSGTPLANLRANLLISPAGSAHTQSAIATVYQDILDRAPTSSESATAAANIASGQDFNDLRHALISTTAGQAYVTQEITAIYDGLTGHNPTSNDVSHWSAFVAAAGDQNASASLLSAITADPVVVDTIDRQSSGAGVQQVANGAHTAITLAASTTLLVVNSFDPTSSTITLGTAYHGVNPLDATHAQQITALNGATDVLITLDSHHSILLENTQLSALHASDFH